MFNRLAQFLRVTRSPQRKRKAKGSYRHQPCIQRLENRALLSASGSFALYTGDLTAPNELDTMRLGIDTGNFIMPGGGSVMIGLVLRPAEGSPLDPGLIKVSPGGGGPSKPDTAGSNHSLTLAEVGIGDYEITVRAEKQTTGAYELDVFLAGDANGDFQVDQQDFQLIRGLKGVKLHKPMYLLSADVDQNGVINGGDLQRAESNLGASTQLRIEPANPLDEFLLDPGALSLDGASPTTFNARSAPLQFTLSGAEFYQSLGEVQLTVNGVPVPSGKLSIASQAITATSVLVDGRNDLSLSAVDTVGRPLYLNTTLWAGSATLRVNLVDQSGQSFLEPATVVVSLSDDQSVAAQGISANGFVEFQNVPLRTILVRATASGNRSGFIGDIGTQGSVQVRMVGFDAPTTINNNDFSQGTAGWNIGSAPVQIVSHVENLPGQFAALFTAPETLSATAIPTEGHETGRLDASEAAFQSCDAQQTSPAVASFAAASIVDNDLVLTTTVEGEQSISRSFTTEQGTTAVRIRYRFITSEVPGGYFGSQYNDYFRVSLRSEQGGGFAGEFNSMNGLGLAAFDFATGTTAWRDVTLHVNPQGDTIQVDVGVANVGDGAFDSQVAIDFVEEVKDQVKPSLSWNSIQGGIDLSYRVENAQLAEATTISVYFANGTGYNNHLGNPVFTFTVPVGTSEGQHGPIRINGNLLGNDPAGTTHLIAVASETSVGSLADVQVGYGANANAAVVNAALIDVIKDGLRVAGQSSATITSTARTPADQARAMFQNLTNANNTLAQNIGIQQGIYAPPGDAVIGVFASMVQGLTLQQVLSNAANIRAAMEQEIINQGPSNVSRHCADPAGNVVDVAAGAFNATNGPLFVGAVQSRLGRFIDERNTNGCYHLEL